LVAHVDGDKFIQVLLGKSFSGNKELARLEEDIRIILSRILVT
jgi:hypothetical protein